MTKQEIQLQLHYETVGDSDTPAVLLLHGFMSSNAQWLMNIDALSEHFFLVMVELWGHGQSPTPSDTASYSITSYLQQFERIRTDLNIPHWCVVGQSYGAGLMVNYAIHHPDRTDAVIVTNSRSAFGQLERAQKVPQDDSQNSSDPTEFDPRTYPYHPIHARRFPEQVKLALVENADAISAMAIKLGGTLGGQLNCIDKLANVKAPILLTNGIYEKSFQADARKLRSLYPDLHVADLEGGHSVNIEAADGFNQAVLEFLRDQNLRDQKKVAPPTGE